MFLFFVRIGSVHTVLDRLVRAVFVCEPYRLINLIAMCDFFCDVVGGHNGIYIDWIYLAHQHLHSVRAKYARAHDFESWLLRIFSTELVLI